MEGGSFARLLLCGLILANVVLQCQGVATLRFQGLACEFTTIYMFCPLGYDIRVDNAFFGRNDNRTCLTGGNDNQMGCYVDDATAVVRYQCEGKSSCQMQSSIGTFGLPGNCLAGDGYTEEPSKYLRVSYRCEQTVYTAQLCEDSGRLPLACQANHFIFIEDAFYGRNNSETCYHENNLDITCQANNTYQVMRQMCEGMSYCEVDPTSDIFGDPCPDTHKYLRVKYVCAECTNEVEDTLCEYWANLGECVSNPVYMMPNCRKACTKCDQTPSGCVNVEVDEDCDYWRDNGFCESNPAWMMPNCRKSCVCDDRPVRAPAQIYETESRDQLESCPGWAEAGYCTDNPDFMLANCMKSCSSWDSQVMCENTHGNDTQCEQWAADGQCDENPGFMFPFCYKSCTGCVENPRCENINADDDLCTGWYLEGECGSNPVWMYTNCWKACTLCEGIPINDEPKLTESRDLDGYCPDWAEQGFCTDNPGFMLANCMKSCSDWDSHVICENSLAENETNCDQWAAQGHCGVNPGYMFPYCYQSCSGCVEDPMCENVHANDTECTEWYLSGECEANPGFMYIYCWKACTLCEGVPQNDTEVDVPDTVEPRECKNEFENEAECEWWRITGECYRNPDYMLTWCYKSCSRCGSAEDNREECTNILNDDESCNNWADIGECSSNPDWMFLYCWKSCTLCDTNALSNLNFLGREAFPGDLSAFTESKTFLLGGEVQSRAKLDYFTAFFTGSDPVHLQIWRPDPEDNEEFTMVYEKEVSPHGTNFAETIPINDECFQLEDGDKVGFTTFNRTSPIAYEFDLEILQDTIYFRNVYSSDGFDFLYLPYAFSLGASYNTSETCDGSK